MTVIAYKDGVLAADSASFSGGRRFSAMHPKVIECSVGLVGAAGRTSDTEAYRAWMAAGMPENRPALSMDKEESLQAVWVKPDGSFWWTDERLVFVQIETPGTIGEPNAAAFVDGCMLAGMSADAAVTLAIRHCVYVGGDVTVVRLHNYMRIAS